MSNELVPRSHEAPLNMSVPQIANAFACSGLFKDAQDEAKAVTKILAGRSIGLDPFSSMAGLHVMDGKVEIGAHLIAARIKSSGKYNYRVEAKTDTVCRLAFYEDGELQGTEEFTMADAQAAKLVRPGSAWTKHPKAMLFARCVSAGYRTYCPDIFTAPVYVEGEVSGGRNDEPEEPRLVKATVVDSVPAQSRSSGAGEPNAPHVDPNPTMPPGDAHSGLRAEIAERVRALRELGAMKAADTAERWVNEGDWPAPVLAQALERLDTVLASVRACKHQHQTQSQDGTVCDVCGVELPDDEPPPESGQSASGPVYYDASGAEPNNGWTNVPVDSGDPRAGQPVATGSVTVDTKQGRWTKCERCNKRGYDSEAEAERQHKGSTGYRFYREEACGYWHATTQADQSMSEAMGVAEEEVPF